MQSESDQNDSTEIDLLIQGAVLSLKEPIDFKLMSLLIRKGPLSFSQLREKLKLKSTTLDRCLKRLMNGALLNNYYAKKKDGRAYSFYEVTLLGQDLFDCLKELGRPSSVVPSVPNPFYQPGPDILDYVQKMSGLLEQLRQHVEMARSVKE